MPNPVEFISTSFMTVFNAFDTLFPAFVPFAVVPSSVAICCCERGRPKDVTIMRAEAGPQ